MSFVGRFHFVALCRNVFAANLKRQAIYDTSCKSDAVRAEDLETWIQAPLLVQVASELSSF